METLIKISFAGGWVLKHKDDEALPVKALEKHLKALYDNNVTVRESSLTALVFATSVAEEEIKKALNEFLAQKYELGEDNAVVSFIVAPMEESDDKDAVEDARNQGESKQDENIIGQCLDKIKAVIAGEQFKALVDEIVKVAPQIIKNKASETFTYQSYVFSINNGYGLTTYLHLFAELLAATGIVNINQMRPVIEEKLLPPKGEGMEPFADAIQMLRQGNKERLQIMSIDISEWMNSMETKQFKDFLMLIERHMNEFIFVFRIPFVDKEVLRQICYSLNDLVYVREISFAPFNKGELEKCAEQEFSKFGFAMSKSAWEFFHLRISEEKSDGKFYGLNTIRKVVRELLYRKQLLNATAKKPNNVISKKDAAEICGYSKEDGLSGYEMLAKMVGGESIKARIDEIISQIELAKRDSSLGSPCIHMRFVGNPGTGKTTVARIVGKILKEKGVLRIGNFFEYAGRDFCGRYVGETAPKTASICRDAYGSVLFIDEAYSLYRGDDNDRDYGREALDTLIAEMENHRSDLVVIMAGYTNEMDKLMKGNTGLASRMPYVIEFPNFTRSQLNEIFCSMIKGRFKVDQDLLPAVKEYFDSLPDEVILTKEFSNARFVRNLFERTWAKAAMRCQLNKTKTVTLTKDDFLRSTNDGEFKQIMHKRRRIGFN